MASFEITGPNGQIYDIDAPNEAGAKEAFRQFMAQQDDNVDDIVQDLLDESRGPVLNPETGMPEGYFTDPTQQYTHPQTGETIYGVTTRDALKEQLGNQSNTTSGIIGSGQGVSLGGIDELAGMLNRLNISQGGTADQRATYMREKARAASDAGREENPIASFLGEMAGGLSIPGGVQMAKTGMQAIPKGTLYGAGFGGAYAFGAGEGSFENRLSKAEDGVVVGGLFGAATPPLINLARTGANKTWNALFKKSVEVPSLQNLRNARKQAYTMVDAAGEKINPDAIDDMVLKSLEIMDSAGYVAGSQGGHQPQIEYALKTLSNMTRLKPNGDRVKEYTLSGMETVRKDLMTAYKKSDYDPRIKDLLNNFDKVIENSGGSELMKAARASHIRFKKVEILDTAMQRAEDTTGATGSGGNINNKYRSALDKIINGKNASYFNEKEIQVMRNAVRGDVDSNVLRLVGKLSPGGNGLMTFLNLAAVSSNPAMLSATLAGAAAKKSADAGQKKIMDDIQAYLATGKAPVVQPKFAAGAPVGALQLNQEGPQ